MIMSYLAYKKPLPPDQIGKSLNEQMLPNAQQLEQQARIDEMSEMYEDEFMDDNNNDGPGTNVYFNDDDDQTPEETKLRKSIAEGGDEFEDIEEEPNIVTIKTLTPSSQ